LKPISKLQAALDEVRADCNTAARRAQDPVGFVHRYTDPRDQELVGLLAASLAFGNVTAIRAKLEEALQRMGPSPYMAAEDAQGLRRALSGWVHRVYRGEDIAGLLAGARAVQRAAGSLGARFAADLEREGDLRAALAAFCDAIREAGGFPLRKLGKGDRRGPSHLLPDPRGGSGSKRLLLYLRWMIRPADGIDLGLWPVSPAVLLCPVDTHIHKLARNLGLCARANLSWETTAEITAGLRRFDPEDPVKYDFSLCHMGMLQRCPSRRDALRCDGCAVKPVCRHWQTKAALGKRALSLVP
jgi:uncharacterized protein (TIGR02757 family)